jgi:hypothetical protein
MNTYIKSVLFCAPRRNTRERHISTVALPKERHISTVALPKELHISTVTLPKKQHEITSHEHRLATYGVDVLPCGKSTKSATTLARLLWVTRPWTARLTRAATRPRRACSLSIEMRGVGEESETVFTSHIVQRRELEGRVRRCSHTLHV